jgi:hypothetical protein
VTDPPYPNNAGHFVDAIQAAEEVCSNGDLSPHWLVFWSELSRPPCKPPLVAVHIWHRTNVNGRPYEPMAAYYNEIDPHAAQWLRNLIAAGHIAPGDVDERSIVDVRR